MLKQSYVAIVKRKIGQSLTENEILQSTNDRDISATMIEDVSGHDT